jgi:spermidine/putrescine transport system substrate-binding protein
MSASHAIGRIKSFIGRTVIACALVFRAGGAAAQDLVVLNWQGYLDPALIEKFEAARGARITEVNFESDDQRDAMMIQADGAGYDVVLVNGTSLHAYVRHGWLARLDTARVPNVAHIDPAWRTAYAEAPDYAVPYFWGLIGIAYHADKLGRPLAHWMDLLRPAPELQGRIAMLDNAREVTAVALRALGYDVNATAPDQIDAAMHLLDAQRPFVKTYEYIDLSHGGLESGDVLAALAYSGDWIGLHRDHPEIAYVVPSEGSVRWVDYLTVPSASRHAALAWDFINFLNEPGNARQLARYVDYPSPHRAAAGDLSHDKLAHELQNPPAELLSRCALLVPMPPRSARLVNAAFTRIAARP